MCSELGLWVDQQKKMDLTRLNGFRDTVGVDRLDLGLGGPLGGYYADCQ